MWPQLQNEMVTDQLTKFTKSRFSWWAARIWRRSGQRYQPPAMIAHDRYDMTGTTELPNCWGNVIEPTVVPYYARRHGSALIFQNDNARAHRARVVRGYLQFRWITTLPWPAKFPDLSPVEHVWDILGRRARRWPHERQDINELADSLQEEWRRIPQAITGRLIRSMRRPCLACLAANGGPTRYWDFCEIDVLTLTKSQIQAKWLVKTFCWW